MKKILLSVLIFGLLYGISFAQDQSIYMGWVPDPIPTVTGQSVWHDQDSTIDNAGCIAINDPNPCCTLAGQGTCDPLEVWSGTATDNVASFSYTGSDYPNDTVFHRTSYESPIPPIDTVSIAPSASPGATGLFVVQQES